MSEAEARAEEWTSAKLARRFEQNSAPSDCASWARQTPEMITVFPFAVILSRSKSLSTNSGKASNTLTARHFCYYTFTFVSAIGYPRPTFLLGSYKHYGSRISQSNA